MASTSSQDATGTSRRKRVVLSIDDKVKIIELLDKGVSYAVIMEKYNIGKATVSNMKKNKEKILNFKREMVDMGMKKKAKVMKVGDDQRLDQAVFVWFKQKRAEGVPISGPLLCEKALELGKIIQGEDTKFKASEGWKWRFCQRHGIRQLSFQGEKLSADKEAADQFVPKFKKLLEEKKLSLNQVFNCDETGLNYRLLPQSTLASSFEKSVDGRKKSKDRVTLNVCANATGTIKLPIHLIGKAQRPRCFKGIKMELLPLKYSGQTNAWMTSNTFYDWFHQNFVPYVGKSLISLGEEPKAVLLLDNCSAHPEQSELVSEDGQIFAHFLPANVTSLIQPMDQGVLQAIKMKYKKKLLRRLIVEDDVGGSIIEFIKKVNMKTIVELVAASWAEIQPITLRRSWQKIIPIPKSSSKMPTSTPPSSSSAQVDILPEVLTDALHESCDEASEVTAPDSHQLKGYFVWRGIRVRFRGQESGSVEEEVASSSNEDSNFDELEVTAFRNLFNELGFDVDTDEIAEWLVSDANDSGAQTLTDSEICEFVSKSTRSPEPQMDCEEEDDDSELPKCPVSHSAAARMFEQCLMWLEHQQEASPYNTSVLRELHALSASKRVNSMQQAKLSDYF